MRSASSCFSGSSPVFAAQKLASLHLIQEKIIHRFQRERGNSAIHGRRVQHDLHAPLVGFFHNIGNFVDLILQYQHVVLTKLFQHPIRHFPGNGTIGPAVKHDAVISAMVVLDDGTSGLLIFQHRDQLCMHARIFQAIQQEQAVLAYGPGVIGLRACAGEGHGLIKSLSPAENVHFFRSKGLPLLHKMGHPIGIVDIQRTKAQNLHRFSSSNEISHGCLTPVYEGNLGFVKAGRRLVRSQVRFLAEENDSPTTAREWGLPFQWAVS